MLKEMNQLKEENIKLKNALQQMEQEYQTRSQYFDQLTVRLQQISKENDELKRGGSINNEDK